MKIRVTIEFGGQHIAEFSSVAMSSADHIAIVNKATTKGTRYKEVHKVFVLSAHSGYSLTGCCTCAVVDYPRG